LVARSKRGFKMTSFRPKLTDNDKYILNKYGIREYISLAAKSENHEAYNLLLAAAHYLDEFNNKLSNEIAFKLFNNYMYNRIYYLEPNGFTIRESELSAIYNIREKIKTIAEVEGKQDYDIVERVNALILNILISERWWNPS